jgi:hypothetical protein
MILALVMNASEFVNALVQTGLRHDCAAYLSGLNEISPKGIRSFGIIDLLGWPQIVEINSGDTTPAKMNMPIIATGMDGRWVLLDCDSRSVVLCDQFDPSYPDSFLSTQVDLKMSLPAYLSAVVESSPTVPTDYEEALRFSDRAWN